MKVVTLLVKKICMYPVNVVGSNRLLCYPNDGFYHISLLTAQKCSSSSRKHKAKVLVMHAYLDANVAVSGS